MERAHIDFVREEISKRAPGRERNKQIAKLIRTRNQITNKSNYRLVPYECTLLLQFKILYNFSYFGISVDEPSQELRLLEICHDCAAVVYGIHSSHLKRASYYVDKDEENLKMTLEVSKMLGNNPNSLIW